MFRDTEDYNRGFNCFAIALHQTDSTGLCESFMSTHTHQMLQTNTPAGFMHCFRKSYSMYFNNKYQRTGKLGERHHFCMEINGYHHLIAAMSYTMRNAVHHGIAPIPYSYPHCSANAIFRKEMGKHVDDGLLSEKSYYRHISRRASVPSNYKMNKNGVFIRESVLDIPQVENLFVTPRAFNYYMSRKSSEEWEAEQQRDGNNRSIINLFSIERGITLQDINQMVLNEAGKSDYRKISDIELCTELDALARDKYGRHSVYQLTDKEKIQIAENLYNNRHINEKQIRRALAML